MRADTQGLIGATSKLERTLRERPLRGLGAPVRCRRLHWGPSAAAARPQTCETSGKELEPAAALAARNDGRAPLRSEVRHQGYETHLQSDWVGRVGRATCTEHSASRKLHARWLSARTPKDALTVASLAVPGRFLSRRAHGNDVPGGRAKSLHRKFPVATSPGMVCVPAQWVCERINER